MVTELDQTALAMAFNAIGPCSGPYLRFDADADPYGSTFTWINTGGVGEAAMTRTVAKLLGTTLVDAKPVMGGLARVYINNKHFVIWHDRAAQQTQTTNRLATANGMPNVRGPVALVDASAFETCKLMSELQTARSNGTITQQQATLLSSKVTQIADNWGNEQRRPSPPSSNTHSARMRAREAERNLATLVRQFVEYKQPWNALQRAIPDFCDTPTPTDSSQLPPADVLDATALLIRNMRTRMRKPASTARSKTTYWARFNTLVHPTTPTGVAMLKASRLMVVKLLFEATRDFCEARVGESTPHTPSHDTWAVRLQAINTATEGDWNQLLAAAQESGNIDVDVLINHEPVPDELLVPHYSPATPCPTSCLSGGGSM